jgi:hypothetical protein
MRKLSIVIALLVMSAAIGGCEQNAQVVVAREPVLLSTPPETAITSMGTLNTSTQNVREAILATARDLQMSVAQEPGPGIEGEAVLTPPSGNQIRVRYREVAPNQVELTARRDGAPAGQEIDSITRRIFDETRDRALSRDPAAPRIQPQ